MRSWLRRYASWLERGAPWIVVGLLALTVALAAQLPHLSVHNDLQTFYPDDALTRTYRQISQTFGGDKFPTTLYVRFTPVAEPATSPQAVVEMERALQAVRALPGVVRAHGFPDLVKLIAAGTRGEGVEPASAPLPANGDGGHTFEQLIQLTTQRLSSVRDYLSARGTGLVLVELDPDAELLALAGAVATALQPLAESARATRVELMGYGNALREFNAATVADVRLLLPLAAALMAVVLLWSFRQPLSAWLTVGALVGAVSAWSLDGAVPAAWQAAGVALALALGLAALTFQLRARRLRTRAGLAALLLVATAALLVGAAASWTAALLLLAAAILALSFRSLSQVYLPLIVVGVAAVWTFGLMALSGVAMSFLMIAILPLLLGVGLDDSLHLLHRYRQEREAGRPHADALAASLASTGHAVWLTTVTTVAGFAALLFSSSPPVQAFGLLATFAMVSALIATLLLVPAVSQMLPNWRPAAPRPQRVERRAVWFRRWAQPRWARVWLLVVAALGVGLFVSGQSLKVYPYDLRWMLPPDSEQGRLYEEINDEFKNYDQVQLLLEGDVARLEVMRTLIQVLEPALSASPYVRGVRHVGRLLDDVRFARPDLERAFMASFVDVPDQAYRELLDRVWDESLLHDRFQSLIRRDANGAYSAAVVRVNVQRAHTPEEVAAVTADIERRMDAIAPQLGGLTLSLTGSPYLEALSLVALKQGFFQSMWLAFGLIGLVLAATYRSLWWALACLAPMALVMACVLAAIQWLGIHISASTALVAALAIGLGVDYTIHLTQRVRETGQIALGFARVSPTLLAASATSLAAFLTLVLGRIPWNQDFGVLASLAIVFALLLTVGVYPALLYVLKPRLGLAKGEK